MTIRVDYVEFFYYWNFGVIFIQFLVGSDLSQNSITIGYFRIG